MRLLRAFVSLEIPCELKHKLKEERTAHQVAEETARKGHQLPGLNGAVFCYVCWDCAQASATVLGNAAATTATAQSSSTLVRLALKLCRK